MKVFRSSHQNLNPQVSGEGNLVRVKSDIPLGFGILSHAVPHGVYLFPALAPFVSVALFGAHVHNLQIVTPFLCVPPLVFDAVSFNCPFSRPLPVHYSSTHISRQYYNIFTTSS